MPLIALASVKGSPGCTTAALALATAWPAARRLLIEADPSGGDLAPWLGLRRRPGLPGLAAASREGNAPVEALQHAQEIGGGLHVIAAPPGAGQATACLEALDLTTVLAPFRTSPPVAIIDCGRLDPSSPSLGVIGQSDAVVLIARPHVSDLAHLVQRLDSLGLTRPGMVAGLLLAPPAARMLAMPAYPPRDVEATLGLPVLADIPYDPQAVAYLAGGARSTRRALRFPLMRAAAALAGRLITATTRAADPAREGTGGTKQPVGWQQVAEPGHRRDRLRQPAGHRADGGNAQ